MQMFCIWRDLGTLEDIWEQFSENPCRILMLLDIITRG